MSEAMPVDAIAAELVAARLAARPLPQFPGPLPPDLATAYAIQDAAIERWPDRIAGWKIGFIPPPERPRHGSDRLAGPIFARQVRTAGDFIVEFPVFVGGFAAVEAEFVFRLGRDAPAGKQDWTEDDAAALVDALHIGVENAGSPLAAINDLGGAVTTSDFGNNAGLIVGPEIAGWRARDLAELKTATAIGGAQVGTGSAASVAGGPLASLVFLLGNCARRGRPLRSGQLISTGATTGVHRIEAGQSAEADFGSFGSIRCRAVAPKAG